MNILRRKWLMNRRTFLRGTGAAIALPWLEAMGANSTSDSRHRAAARVGSPLAGPAQTAGGPGGLRQGQARLVPLDVRRDVPGAPDRQHPADNVSGARFLEWHADQQQHDSR